MSRKVEEDVDLIGADLLGNLCGSPAAHIAPSRRMRRKLRRHRILACERVAEDLEATLVKVREEGEAEERDDVEREVGRDVADADLPAPLRRSLHARHALEKLPIASCRIEHELRLALDVVQGEEVVAPRRRPVRQRLSGVEGRLLRAQGFFDLAQAAADACGEVVREHLLAARELTRGERATHIFERIAPAPEQKYGTRTQEKAEAVLAASEIQPGCTRGVLSLLRVDVESRRQTPYIALRPVCGEERVGGGKRLAKVSRRKESLERNSEPRRFLGRDRRLCRIVRGERRFVAGFESCRIGCAVHQR